MTRPADDPPATSQPVQTIAADPRRPLIRIPTLLCPAIAGPATLVALLAGAANHADIARATTPAIAVPLILLGLVRWTAATTRLHLDPEGLAYEVRGTRWTARWDRIRSVFVRTYWEGTSPGGGFAGVRLTLADGTVRDIPDTQQLPRHELAALIDRHRTTRTKPP